MTLPKLQIPNSSLPLHTRAPSWGQLASPEGTGAETGVEDGVVDEETVSSVVGELGDLDVLSNEELVAAGVEELGTGDGFEAEELIAVVSAELVGRTVDRVEVENVSVDPIDGSVVRNTLRLGVAV